MQEDIQVVVGVGEKAVVKKWKFIGKRFYYYLFRSNEYGADDPGRLPELAFLSWEGNKNVAARNGAGI
jgi:hypothetical protein